MSRQTVEIRFELPAEEVSVLDGYGQATGKTRRDVIRALLKDWSLRKHHEATLITRVAGDKPAQPESGWGTLE